MELDQILREKNDFKSGLTFDDLLLLPNYTDFKRQAVDLTAKLHPNIILKLPMIAAPMDTVCEVDMAVAIAQVGGLGIIHRNLALEAQKKMIRQVKSNLVTDIKKAAVDEQNRLLVGAAVSPTDDLKNRLHILQNEGVDLIVIDSGHGHSRFVRDAVLYIKKYSSKLPLMAGNVATYEGARMLVAAGCDILRVGMGPGSICTTRIVTGVGVPQITAIFEAVKAVAGSKATVVADGGIRQIGDMAKTLAAGASAVMLGSLLARFDESPGNSVMIKGKKYKQYRGMGSSASMKQGGAVRYGQTVTKTAKTLIAEGIEGLVEHKGKVADYLTQVEGSLRSSFYYVGAKTLAEFFVKSRFIKISQASLLESHPHSIIVKNPGDNYTL